MRLGVKSLYYAVMNDEDAETFDAPVKVDGVSSINISANSGTSKFYADNKLHENIPYITDFEITLELAQLNPSTRAALLGNTLDASGVLTEKTTDKPPYVALGYKITKSNGSDVYVWLFKGKFRVPDESIETEGETPEPQSDEIIGEFSDLDDGRYKKYADEDAPGYTDVSGTWFDSVYDGGDSTPYIVLAEPYSGETDVDVTQDLTVVFNKELDGATVDNTNVTLNDGVSVSCTVTLESDGKTINVVPDTDMQAATSHTLAISTGVTDIDGNAVASGTDITFTTA